MKNVIALWRGLWITLRYLFKKTETIQYPDEQPVISPRFRGQIVFNMDPATGSERCTGCGICSKECPEGAITVTRKKLETTDPETGEAKSIWRPDEFFVDGALCVFCGLCAESCPFNAIKFIPEFELGTYCRDDLKRDVDDLRQGNLTGGSFKPWLVRETEAGEEAR